MANVYVTIGFPGCGKSTYAKKSGLKVLSSDDLREMYGISAGDTSVFELMNRLFTETVRRGEDVVYDATSLRRDNRENIIRLAKDANKEVVVTDVFFDVPISVCKERNRSRERVVPEFVYDKMSRTFVKPSLSEGFDEMIVITN